MVKYLKKKIAVLEWGGWGRVGEGGGCIVLMYYQTLIEEPGTERVNMHPYQISNGRIFLLDK